VKIVSWCIEATLENGETVELADMPDEVASMVDEWLTELEADD